MSVNDHTSSARPRNSSSRDCSLWPKLRSIPRTHSHGVGCTVSNTVYSGVRTSNIGGLGGTMPLSAAADRAASRSSSRRAGAVRASSHAGDHGMKRSFTTPSGTAR